MPNKNQVGLTSMDNCQGWSFCECAQTIAPLWQNNGISKCFYHALSATVMAVLSLIILFSFCGKRRLTERARRKTTSVSHLVEISSAFFLSLCSLAELAVVRTLDFPICGGSQSILVLRFGLTAISWWMIAFQKKQLVSGILCIRSSSRIIWLILLSLEMLCITSIYSESWWFAASSVKDKISLCFWIGRIAILLLLVLTANVTCTKYWGPKATLKYDQKSGKLLQSKNSSGKVERFKTWRGFSRKLRTLSPHLWPSNDFRLQLHVLLCIALLLLGSFLNPQISIYSKTIVNSLIRHESWKLILSNILFLIGFKLLKGSMFSDGMLQILRQYFWIRVRQYNTRHLQARLFQHLHSLPLGWHLARKTGAVLESMQRGTKSINLLLFYIFFNLLPSICDICVAVVFFVLAFNAWFGLLIVAWLLLYCFSTVSMTEWYARFRRTMNLKDNRAKQVAFDSLLNFETIKCYNTASYEALRFEDAIASFQDSEYLTSVTLILLKVVQIAIIHSGLLIGTILCAKLVADGILQIGDFVSFEIYMSQLYRPMGALGHFYRLIQSSFVDMENMLQLFNEAEKLTIEGGKVEFQHVSFHYDPNKPVLNNISFTVEAGQTFALVGDSGSGKSSIIRLLLRFFEPTSGSIKIDGKDIRSVTQESLRDCVGLVPQDIVLFNDTLLNNICYGQPSSINSEEVKRAADMAKVHHRIVAMPDQYDTMVGERGLKLSGGEKQRVAIARTLLKAPSIVLLDEATSALDLTTEERVQDSLAHELKGKTTIFVAHRLSSVVKADCILVLKNGQIAERGLHKELLKNRGGLYSEMWSRQSLEARKHDFTL